MHRLARILDVNLQFALTRANPDMLLAVGDFDEFGVRKFFQLFHDGVGSRQEFPGVYGSFAEVLPGNKTHGHGDRGGGNPQ